jgi:PAS domain S-box-containing protein
MLFEDSPEGILIADLETREFSYVNPALCKMLGYTKKEIEGMSVADIHPKDSLEHVISEFEAQARGEKTIAYDIPCLRKDGAIIYANINSSKTLIDNRNCNIGFFTDTTERRQTEKALQESEEKFRTFVDTATDLMIITDKNGQLTDVNKAMVNILGYSAEELKKMHIAMLLTEDSRKNELEPNWQKFIKEGKIEIETTFRTKSGNEIFGELKAVAISDSLGNISGTRTIFSDLTHRKLAEQELIKAKEKAEESDRLKSAFLANMSHEIRTPMNALLGFSSLLTDPGITDEKRNEFIPRIRESGDRLLHLIDDIIDSSKIEAGQLGIKMAETSVNKILTELCSFFEEQKHKKGKENIEIRLNKAISGEYFKILTDPYRLKQVLSNLLDNAQKYTDSGYIETGYTVLPAPAKGSQMLRFYVKDTGIGFPESKKDFIFERFHKIEDQKVKLYEGTGLGLAISKNLVNLLGGEMWAESEPGKGSTFYFTLPYKPVHAVQEDVDIRDKITKDISGRTIYLWKDKVILIAEDEENNYSYTKEVLTNTCVQLIRAENGQEAVEICRSDKNIDLVLMDVKMPLMDGYTATKSIKSFRKNLPVIALTAYAGETDKEDSIKAGCDDYLSKPVKHVDLLALINKYI